MIYTPDKIEEKEYNVDICIIGSGAGGSIAAAKLSKKGYKILVIEEGPSVTEKDLDQDARKLVPLMYRRGGGLATDDMSIRILQGRILGGSPTINWMTSLRTPDFVLEEWVRDYGLENYNPKLMEKHFDEVEKRLSVHLVKDTDHNPQNRIILDGCKALGISAETSPNNSIDCIGCGTCGLGCPYNAKQDMRQTYLKDALDNQVKVFTNTRAEVISYENKKSQIIKAIVTRKNDKSFPIKINTKNTIVSAGAIYTPLLLQNSGLTKGNLVGKYFHIHPVTASFAIYDRIIDPTYGIPQSSASFEYQNLDGNGYGFWLEVPDLEPFLISVNFPGIGPSRREEMKQMRKAAGIIVLVRDGADKKSTGEVRWRRGYNNQSGGFSLRKIPSIRYKLSKTDKIHLMKGLENSIEVHFAAGAKEVLPLFNRYTKLTSPDQIHKIRELRNGPNELSLFSAHPTGTTRMGYNSKKSVVDQTMQMHFYPGVYVMDGSVLPTAPGVNPMITILSSISNAIELGSIEI